MHHEDPEVQELTFTFSRFQISVQVRVRDLGPGSDSPDFEFVTGPAQPTGQLSSELEDRVLAATSPEEHAALNLNFLAHLERRLTGSDSVWSPKTRLGRAFKAGVVAKHLLSGSGPTATQTPSVPFRNTIYVILRSPSLPQGGWTLGYSKSISECGGNHRDGDFPRTTVCHAFASRTEAGSRHFKALESEVSVAAAASRRRRRWSCSGYYGLLFRGSFSGRRLHVSSTRSRRPARSSRTWRRPSSTACRTSVPPWSDRINHCSEATLGSYNLCLGGSAMRESW